jgi:hypothetical protein
MTDWQPIATAPKDGTEVLLHGRHNDGEAWYEVGFWGKHSQSWTVAPLDPTHWMELVPPGAIVEIPGEFRRNHGFPE